MDRLAEAKRLFLDALARQEKGDLEQAEILYGKALALAPERPSVMNNLGVVLFHLKKYAEAKRLCERLLEIDPEDAMALLHLGNCQVRLRSAEAALISYERALKIRPDDADTLTCRGIALLELRRPEEALASHDRALAIKPDSAEALHNRAQALRALMRPQEALASDERALEIKPGFFDALHGLGNAFLDLGRYREAAESYEKALAIRPDLEYVPGDLAWARMQCCDWRGRQEEFERLVSAITAGKRSVPPFAAASITDSPQHQLLCSRIWVRDKCSVSPVPIWKGERYRHDRIRLAYLSADFRAHPSSSLLAGLFEHHDRSRFATIAISFGPDDRSEIRTRVKGAFEEYIDVRSRSDLEVARLMRELEVDIAVDLMGHTKYDRMGILALRPAPVQVNYLGYPGTMGAEFIDYTVADKFVIPIDHHDHYAEKIAYLPECFQANDSMRRISERVPTRAEVGLPEQRFVFCCLNNLHKLTPSFFNVWMRLLQRVDHSVLWLLQDNATAVSNLRREAQARSIDPGRLIFSPRVKLEDYLANYRLADLFLDTLPFNAGATASDALWAGLPVLTCAGSGFAGRMAGSLLRAIGLPEMVTNTLEEYEALALKLATHPAELADLRARLTRNRATCPLFDTDRFRRHIEAAYTTMWERYQKGEPPASFAVAPIDK